MDIIAQIRSEVAAKPPAYDADGRVFDLADPGRARRRAERQYALTDGITIGQHIAGASASCRAALESLADVMEHREFVPHTGVVVPKLREAVAILKRSYDAYEKMLGSAGRMTKTSGTNVVLHPITGGAKPLQHAYEALFHGLLNAANHLGAHPRKVPAAPDPIRDLLTVHALLTSGRITHTRSASVNVIALDDYASSLGGIVTNLRCAREGSLTNPDDFPKLVAIERGLVDLLRRARAFNYHDVLQNGEKFNQDPEMQYRFENATTATDFVDCMLLYYQFPRREETERFKTMFTDLTEYTPEVKVLEHFFTRFEGVVAPIGIRLAEQANARESFVSLLGRARQELQECISQFAALDLAELPKGAIADETAERLQGYMQTLAEMLVSHGVTQIEYGIPRTERERGPALHTSTAKELLLDVGAARMSSGGSASASSDDSVASYTPSAQSSEPLPELDTAGGATSQHAVSDERRYAQRLAGHLDVTQSCAAQKQSIMALADFRRTHALPEILDTEIFASVLCHIIGGSGRRAHIRRYTPPDILLPLYKGAIARVQSRSLAPERRAQLLEYLLRGVREIHKKFAPHGNLLSIVATDGAPEYHRIAVAYRALRENPALSTATKRHLTLAALQHLHSPGMTVFDIAEALDLITDARCEESRPCDDGDAIMRGFEDGAPPLCKYTLPWSASQAAQTSRARQLARAHVVGADLYNAQRNYFNELLDSMPALQAVSVERRSELLP